MMNITGRKNGGRVAIVTGGSSGIGKCCAEILIENGCRVYEISRREKGCEGMIHISADVTNEDQVRDAVSCVVEKEGCIDILVNNAGFGISGAIEFTDPESARRQLDVNFFGMTNMVQAVLPVMRAHGRGRIVNMSSVAGRYPIPFQAYYSASKSAVNAYTMALANEVRPFGISVCAVQPGDIHTGFTAARDKEERGDDVYHGRISRSVAKMEKDELNGMSPEKAGKFVAKRALKKRVAPIYTIGTQYRLLILLGKILPESVINRLIGILYGE